MVSEPPETPEVVQKDNNRDSYLEGPSTVFGGLSPDKDQVVEDCYGSKTTVISNRQTLMNPNPVNLITDGLRHLPTQSIAQSTESIESS